MEHRSQKAARVVVVMAGLMAAAGAAELRYEVRHQRALRDHNGVLTIGDQGVSYQQVAAEGKRKKEPRKLERVEFGYEDIQELRVAPDKLVLVTYRDRKWFLGIDQEFEFLLPQGKSFEGAYAMLKDKLDRRFVAALAGELQVVLWELPVKRLGSIQGSEGVLRVGTDRIVYRTEAKRQSRTWRYQDIENVSTSDPYQLTLTTYERAKTQYGSRKGFNFQLKRPLQEKEFESLWRRLNREKGLQFLTSMEERNQTKQ